MKTTRPHINHRAGWRRLAGALILGAAAILATAGTTTPPGRADSARTEGAASVRDCTITYTAHNGAPRLAHVLLPGWYRPGNNPPLPLVISPHGRGATGLSNSKFWGNMPTIGRFAVVSPDGMGRRLERLSYGYRGQIDDLARMPDIVSRALPWVRIDRRRIYALGSSMGGQETLLLVARHPRLLAGAAAMDSVTDLTRRFHQLPSLPCTAKYLERWGQPPGLSLQSAMRREVGGTPTEAPRAYAARSPLHLARQIARSGVPLQIWWSKVDRIVFDQQHQSRKLYRELHRLGPDAPVTAYVGRWRHSTEMRATALLPLALIDFGLLPRGFKACPATVMHVDS